MSDKQPRVGMTYAEVLDLDCGSLGDCPGDDENCTCRVCTFLESLTCMCGVPYIEHCGESPERDGCTAFSLRSWAAWPGGDLPESNLLDSGLRPLSDVFRRRLSPDMLSDDLRSLVMALDSLGWKGEANTLCTVQDPRRWYIRLHDLLADKCPHKSGAPGCLRGGPLQPDACHCTPGMEQLPKGKPLTTFYGALELLHKLMDAAQIPHDTPWTSEALGRLGL